MSIFETITQEIKEEIANDPTGRGYAGKTQDEIAKLMNDAYDIEVTTTEQQPSRMSQIIGQIPFMPNAVTSEDLTKILK